MKVFMHTKRVSARQTGSPEEVVPAESRVATAPSVINSMTNPDAWQWLNRACKKKLCHKRCTTIGWQGAQNETSSLQISLQLLDN